MVLAIYIYDILFVSNDEVGVSILNAYLHLYFMMQDLQAPFFPHAIEFSNFLGKLFLSQRKYGLDLF